MKRLKFSEAVVGNADTADEYRFAAGEIVDIEDDRRADRWLRRGKAVETDEPLVESKPEKKPTPAAEKKKGLFSKSTRSKNR